ncbi:hypothetical protein Glove_284g63 [Diversispora epigaea]|uniref:J domain-containing protein n=1 Tax=Diversispora epigaea TaxID=1348612 RepID=A0A397I125_9GLOM|nr:hypothetical protein Glove_284g63 [Diversispora epigaea]
MQYIYDEQGVTFNYFLITFLAIFLIPTTISLFSKSKETKKISKLNCSCEPCQNKVKWIKSQKSGKLLDRVNKKAIAVVIGWIFFTYLAYKISTVKVHVEIWDPYEVLGINEGTDIAVIKKQFKELSRIWHPDKAPTGKENEYEEKFIDFTKAYKVLTDEDTRKNYEEWGHPDGKQAYSLGIALPTWLIEAKNSPFVLGVYGIAFGLLLPFLVGRWWYSSNNYTKDGIRTHTMELYFKELKDSSSAKQILELLSASIEYLELVEQRPSDNTKLLPVINSIKEDLDRRFGEKYEKSKRYTAPYCQKANAMIYAHLLRINIDDKLLLKDKYFIIERAIHLINGILEIALAHNWLKTSIRCMEVSQLLVQAMWIHDNQFVQLPYVTNDVLKSMRIKKKVIRNIAQFRELNDDERRNAIKLSDPLEYDSIMRIAELYPIIRIEDAYFKVPGYDIITTGSIVTLLIKIKIIDPSSNSDDNKNKNNFKDKKSSDKIIRKKNKNNNNNNNNNNTGNDINDNTSNNNDNTNNNNGEDVDDEKGDYLDSEDELLYSNSKKKNATNEESSPLVHAPYLSKDKKPYWWIFMADDKKDRVLTEPIKISDIVVTSTKIVKFQFQAPPEPGFYSYVVYIMNDSYVGTDIRKDLKLVVKDSSALPPDEDIDDEISEPEEDSIAGQMKLMREQGFAAAVVGGNDNNKKSDKKDKKKKLKNGNKDDNNSSSSDDSSDDD